MNPYHDPKTGRFTNAPGGGSGGSFESWLNDPGDPELRKLFKDIDDAGESFRQNRQRSARKWQKLEDTMEREGLSVARKNRLGSTFKTSETTLSKIKIYPKLSRVEKHRLEERRFSGKPRRTRLRKPR